MKTLKLATRTDNQAAVELDRELRGSGASNVEILDTVIGAFSSESARLTAHREAYLGKVRARIRAVKGV